MDPKKFLARYRNNPVLGSNPARLRRHIARVAAARGFNVTATELDEIAGIAAPPSGVPAPENPDTRQKPKKRPKSAAGSKTGNSTTRDHLKGIEKS